PGSTRQSQDMRANHTKTWSDTPCAVMSEPVRASHPESFHRIPVGMCRRAVNGTFLWANAAILELLGATTLDTLLELDHLPEAPHEHESFVQRLVAQGPLGGISATWRTLRGDA